MPRTSASALRSPSPVHKPPARPVLGALVVGYLVAAALFAYGIYDQSVVSDAALAGAAFAAAAAHLAFGFVVRRWWTLVLPPLGVLLAIPAGYPEDVGGEPFPVALGMAIVVGIPGLVLLAGGVGLGKVLERAAAARPSP